MITIDESVLIKIRETIRPVALAIRQYDREYPSPRPGSAPDSWCFAGTMRELTLGDLRAVDKLLTELEDLKSAVLI